MIFICNFFINLFFSLRYTISEDQWKRREGSEADLSKSAEERQIIRVSQAQQQPSPSQQGAKQFHAVEPVSPPEITNPNHYVRRFYESTSNTTATTTSSGIPSKPHLLDYVKNKIVEVMRTEDDKSTTATASALPDERTSGNNGNGQTDKDDKSADSPTSGEMVIDEGPSPQQQQQLPPPLPQPPAPTNFYPFSALGVHTGPPPPSTAPSQPTAQTTGSSAPIKTEQVEPAPLLSAQYEPLSDED